MAGKSRSQRINSTEKYKVRQRNYCQLCARPRAYYRKFGICRICFRDLANKGMIPGVRKASW